MTASRHYPGGVAASLPNDGSRSEPDELVSDPAIPAEAYKRFAGCWVALRGGRVVAASETLPGLRERDDVQPTDVTAYVEALPTLG